MPDGLHLLARRVVDRVIAQGGKLDALEHFGDLAELDRLAREMSNPPIAAELDLLDAPVVVDGVALRRLSWAAREWLADSAYGWWADDPATLDLAYAWAMAHARNKRALQAVRHNPAEARRIVREWAADTTANYDAILAACRFLSPKPKPRQERKADEPDPGVGPILLTLLTETNHPLDYWIFEAPAELVEETLARIHENWRADTARLARALGKDVAPYVSKWHLAATRRFNDAAAAFEKKLTGGGKAGIGPVKPDGAAVVLDNGVGVKCGEGVQEGEIGPAVEKYPPADRAEEKEGGAPPPAVGELSPTGEQQGADPVVG
ncbi:MAG TPA: hypothetical protein PKE26_11885 [Kiritimatiellia bacterium]|nr:hypothetical protein [Kiritimatiellia bacterium]HMO99801.1 hypothetical protein [Kiritimatiellia bacterium]HMP97220.1 hypothetical protein [Kiritimatiellia bacterium]